MHAVKAAKNVKIEYKSLGVPVLSIKDAIERESFFPDPDPLMMGDEGVSYGCDGQTLPHVNTANSVPTFVCTVYWYVQ